jgi:hypothetical protein
MPLLNFMTQEPEKYRDAQELRLTLDPRGEIAVVFQDDLTEAPGKALERAQERLQGMSLSGLKETVSEVEGDISVTVEMWSQRVSGSLPPASVDRVKQIAAEAKMVVDEKAEDLADTIGQQCYDVTQAMRKASADVTARRKEPHRPRAGGEPV